MNILDTFKKYIQNLDNVFIITIWFLTNYIFTIHNKKLLNFSNLNTIIVSIGIIQLGICVIYGFTYLIILNKKNILSNNFNLQKYILLGCCNILCHIFSIYSYKINSLTNHQLIKSIEPIFIIFFDYLYSGNKIKLNQIIFIGLIIFGGILSSLRFTNNRYVFELNWIGLMHGLLSNVFSCIKLFLTKSVVIKDYKSKNLIQKISNSTDPINYDSLLLEYNFINLFTFIIGLPIWYICEGNKINDIKIQIINNKILKYLISSSLSFYFFNYYSIIILNKINVNNQIILGITKKIIIIIMSFIFFNDEINFFGILGIIICIVGIIINYLY
jgi:drug/metabolite transporter (DMT)-like permease